VALHGPGAPPGRPGGALIGQNLWTTWFAASTEPTKPVDPATLSHLPDICSVAGPAVSFQITVLKVLAGHPGGRLPVSDLTRCVSILISSGSDWTNRTTRLVARAPGLDIFSQALVFRDSAGWQITEAGRAFLVAIEAPLSEQASPPVVTPTRTLAMRMPNLNLRLKRRRPRGRRAGGGLRNFTAAC